MRGSGLGIVVAAMLVAACTAAPAPPAKNPDSRGMGKYLDGLVQTRQFRGAVEVRRGDEVLLSRGFGQADVASDVPNGVGTRFRIGSVTKQFTALAVLILQEEGKLKVSDPVCAHLATCPATWRPITIEQLLTHTSGLWDINELTEAEIARYAVEIGDTPTPDQLVSVFVDRPLEFAPGSSWKYSNCGYDLLGVVIERLSGQTYGEFLHDRILAPLRMSETAYNPVQQVSDHDAVSYRNWTDPAVAFPDAVSFADGGMYSTATDLTRWARFLRTGDPAVVTPDTLAQLLRPRLDSGPGAGYGYGIETRGTGDAIIHGHGGSVSGFKSYLLIQPATELSVVVLSNLDSVDSDRVAGNLTTLAGT